MEIEELLAGPDGAEDPDRLERLRSTIPGFLLEALVPPLGVAGAAVDMKEAVEDRDPVMGVLSAMGLIPGVPGGRALRRVSAERSPRPATSNQTGS